MRLCHLLLIVAAVIAGPIMAAEAGKVRVACVGDSITQGSGYPGELAKLLGPGYEVVNFGVASTTLLSKGERPYVNEKAYAQVIAFKPDIVILMLGTNDTKPQNYKFIAEFPADCRRLVESFTALESKPKVFLSTPCPVYYDGNWGIDNARLNEGVLPAVKKLADDMRLPLIDMYAAMSGRADLFYRDNVHPIGGGQIMAATVYKALTGKDAPVKTQPPPPEQMRVACIGDSITEGSGYAGELQEVLGNRYIVRNLGVSGSTLLSKGDKPYIRQSKYLAAKDFKPHIAIIMLGTNDTKPHNYAHIKDFAGELTAMVDELSKLESKPKVFLCKPVPVYGQGAFGIDNGRLLEGVIPAIERVATDKDLPLIDMYATMSNKPELFKDNVHPLGGGRMMAAAAISSLRANLAPRPVMGNLVANPGIEAGMKPWITRGGTLAVVSEPVRSGAKALRLSGRKSDWQGPAQDVKAALAAKGEGYYNVRASVRLAQEPAGAKPARAKVIVMTSDDDGMHYLGGHDMPISAGDWADIDDDVHVSWRGALKSALLYIQTGGAPEADIVVDDLALSVCGDGKKSR